MSSTGRSAAIRLAAILLSGGLAHFVAPRWFDSLIPRQLPGSPRLYTVFSGVANLVVGAGLLIPGARKAASTAAAALFIAYMPAKIKLATDWWRSEQMPTAAKLVGIVQLFWQVPLITESLKVHASAS